MVMTGVRRVGMSSLSGIKASSGQYPLARRRSLRERLLSVVARPHQRAGRHGLESHRVRLALELGELVRVPVAHYRQVVSGGPQVLPHGEHLDAVLAQHAEGLEQLLLGLA